MIEDGSLANGNWVWGALWAVYGLFYALYFAHVASRIKPRWNLAEVPGSPERLTAKKHWCYRFALFMSVPTAMEAVRATLFTSLVISIVPCIFGVWVMISIYREVLRSKMPSSCQIGDSR